MLGVPLEALGLVLGVALHLAREILGVLLRALGGVLCVAAGTLGRTLRLFGQLCRLPLLTRDRHTVALTGAGAAMRAALEGWLVWKSWSRWSRRSRTCSTSSG